MNFSQAELQMLSALVDTVWPYNLETEDYMAFRLMQEKINAKVNAVTWKVQRVSQTGNYLVRRETS